MNACDADADNALMTGILGSSMQEGLRAIESTTSHLDVGVSKKKSEGMGVIEEFNRDGVTENRGPDRRDSKPLQTGLKQISRMHNMPLNALPLRCLANRVARQALQICYERTYRRARGRMLHIQREENVDHLRRVGCMSLMPHADAWNRERRVETLEFVVARNGLSGCAEYVLMGRRRGPVTGMDIHNNVKEHVKRKYQWGSDIRLWICRDVPWLAYGNDRLPHEDVPCDLTYCHHLLGANVVFFIISSGDAKDTGVGTEQRIRQA